MVKVPAPYTAQQYLLDDHPRTLFPMTTTQVVASETLPQLQAHLQEIFDPASSAALLVQQRCYAAKAGHQMRRTAALDPVAAFFIYDLVFSHRAKLSDRSSPTRRSFGYRFRIGKPISPSVSYGAFRSEIRKAVPKYKHALAFDISAYFNSVYHHDLTEWFEASIAVGPHEQFGQFLRECEDQFDAVVGLRGMLAVILGLRGDGASQDEGVQLVEGWIFGQPSPLVQAPVLSAPPEVTRRG